MIPAPSSPVFKLFLGNLCMVGCCVFYLAWWILAFKPEGAIKGMKSGWLLLPAFLLGAAAVFTITPWANAIEGEHSFFSGRTVLIGGITAYVVLLAVTNMAFHRQVTTELFLIVGWTGIALLEANALYELQALSRSGTIALFVGILLAAVISMVCYLLYYGLDPLPGYIDGMIPLILVAIFMLLMAILTTRAKWPLS